MLWRYLDIAKFIAMLEHSALHFARANTLGDPYEGSYGAPNVQLRPVLYPEVEEEALRHLAAGLRSVPNVVYVNCWHHSDYESEAMWSLYATRDHGIAIRTILASLRDSISSKTRVNIGQVSYVDHATTFIREGNIITPFLHKRRSFAHENEVRALTVHAITGDDNQGVNPSLQPLGINCEVNLSKLVEEVVVTPFAQDWLLEVVQGVAARYGLTAPIRRSALASEPCW